MKKTQILELIQKLAERSSFYDNDETVELEQKVTLSDGTVVNMFVN